ncbi:MAG TPA: thrombospondin type 3 repeat-containing protein, partial [Armatimonadota bacterium]|nr:thrombospondin type 3 repeat-containing protein [Armatimonadota bacterium]
MATNNNGTRAGKVLGIATVMSLGLLAAELAPAAAAPPDWAPARGYRRRTTATTRYTKRQDFDRDGIPNWQDRDIDGDGIPNTTDPNDYQWTRPNDPRIRNGAGTRNYRWDQDRDGVRNRYDQDRDGDGIRNSIDRNPYRPDSRYPTGRDIDRDGIRNRYDR